MPTTRDAHRTPPPRPPFTRRDLLRRSARVAAGALVAAIGKVARAEPTESETTTIAVSAIAGEPFRAADFGIVGVFDGDWLTAPGFVRLLDNFAASPGAFAGVRFFGALSSGTRESAAPRDASGIVWPDRAAPFDFSATLAALDALTARGLVPFVQLSFFPAAVSPAPTAPPTDYDGWQLLVRAFLDALLARYGEEVVRGWWFEVWNEPNIPVFWRGDFDAYLALYRATSDALRGYPIRLGAPALAYLPASEGERAGLPLVRRFLQFLRDAPDVRCDFLSYHQKGTWDAGGVPNLSSLAATGADIAALARAIDPVRFAGLALVNNEADERVGFDTPYAYRMDHRYAAWLAGVLIVHDDLARRFPDFRFLAAADNANLQLVQAPFDGRRALLTRTARASDADLLKTPAYGAYELLRFLGDRHGTVVCGDDCYPATNLLHLVTVGAGGIAALLVSHPLVPDDMPPMRAVEYTVADIPWARVNIARFLIDGAHSNGYAAAGGQLSPPDLAPDDVRAIRQAQELALAAPVEHGVALPDGMYRTHFPLPPYATTLLWITPFAPDIPDAPAWLETTSEDGNVIVRWEPSRAPSFLSYRVTRADADGTETMLAPLSLRAALWVDTAPPPGAHTYTVRTVSASGIIGPAIVARCC